MFECEITLCNIDGWLENIKPAIRRKGLGKGENVMAAQQKYMLIIRIEIN